ncbi:MAG: hypothetical protein NT069_22095, partial [Planctomycetota bacterium]|nr:hypothetical protein [Planctomycetota bacterium]
VFHAVAFRGQGTAAKLIGLSNENQGAETSESGDKLDEKFNSDLNALTLALDAMSASYVTFA